MPGSGEADAWLRAKPRLAAVNEKQHVETAAALNVVRFIAGA